MCEREFSNPRPPDDRQNSAASQTLSGESEARNVIFQPSRGRVDSLLSDEVLASPSRSNVFEESSGYNSTQSPTTLSAEYNSVGDQPILHRYSSPLTIDSASDYHPSDEHLSASHQTRRSTFEDDDLSDTMFSMSMEDISIGHEPGTRHFFPNDRSSPVERFSSRPPPSLIRPAVIGDTERRSISTQTGPLLYGSWQTRPRSVPLFEVPLETGEDTDPFTDLQEFDSDLHLDDSDKEDMTCNALGSPPMPDVVPGMRSRANSVPVMMLRQRNIRYVARQLRELGDEFENRMRESHSHDHVTSLFLSRSADEQPVMRSGRGPGPHSNAIQERGWAFSAPVSQASSRLVESLSRLFGFSSSMDEVSSGSSTPDSERPPRRGRFYSDCQ